MADQTQEKDIWQKSDKVMCETFETIQGIGRVIIDSSDNEDENDEADQDDRRSCYSSDENNDREELGDGIPFIPDIFESDEDNEGSVQGVIEDLEGLKLKATSSQILPGDDDDDEEDGIFVAKGGPIKGSNVSRRPNTHPYSNRSIQGSHKHYGSTSGMSNPDYSQQPWAIGDIIDTLDEAELDGFLNDPQGIPGLPASTRISEPDQNTLLNSIDDVFKIKEALGSTPDSVKNKARFILKNVSTETGGFTIVESDFSMILDENYKHVGIQVPQTVIPNVCIPTDAAMTEVMDTFIQLDWSRSRIIKFRAAIEEFGEKWMIKTQFLKLRPFQDGHDGVKSMLDSLTPEQLQHGFSRINSKSDEEIFKTIAEGRGLLHFLVVSKKSSKADIVALVKRILISSDPDKRNHILRKDNYGWNAFQYACVANRMDEAKFLAEIYHYLGEDLMSSITYGNSILHTLCKSGDENANTFDGLLKLKFFNGIRAFPLDKPNDKGELPLHVLVQKEKCSKRLLSIIHSHWPECMEAKTTENTENKNVHEGSMALHLACQYAQDPATIALLLYYRSEVINQRRNDDFTPLLLLAARSDVNKKDQGLIKLDEQTQLQMIELLLDHGANKFADVNGLLPQDLVHHKRPKVMERLRVSRSCENTRCSPVPRSPSNSSNVTYDVPFSPQYADSPSSVDTGLSGESYYQHNHHHYQHFSPPGHGGGSVTSGFDSDSSSSDHDLDAIASILYQQHPLIQQVVSENFAELDP